MVCATQEIWYVYFRSSQRLHRMDFTEVGTPMALQYHEVMNNICQCRTGYFSIMRLFNKTIPCEQKLNNSNKGNDDTKKKE